jgi:hypothetical protein
MSTERSEKSLGKAIDEIVNALKELNDGSRLVALKAASDYLGLGSPPIAPVSPLTPTTSPVAPTASPAATDIKTLKETKNPASAIEMACIVGFYLQELVPPSERKTELTVEDIGKYFRQAGYPLPKAQRQLLPDAKTAGYMDSPSRGTYRLNAVGYNLVAHRLPRNSGSTSSPKSSKSKIPRKANSKPKRKGR